MGLSAMRDGVSGSGVHMRIYFAGPLFTTAERDFNASVTWRLRDKGHEVFLPQEQEQREATAKTIFESDVGGIMGCDVIVANMDGADPDSGTCFEVGEAWRTKLVLLYRTDIREEGQPFGPYNLMLHQAANTVLNLKWKNVEEIAEAIDTALKALVEDGEIPKGQFYRLNKTRKSP
jgi:nucleoside 2-deoxyribosyltransferase